jgi:hypothetical protein
MDTYYHPKDLGKFADMGKGNKDLWDKFMSYYSAVFAEGALTEREKALIALGVAHGVQCPYLHAGLPGKGLERRRDDGSGPRGLRDPRRGLVGPRGADAQRGRETVDVVAAERLSPTSYRVGAPSIPLARTCRSPF